MKRNRHRIGWAPGQPSVHAARWRRTALLGLALGLALAQPVRVVAVQASAILSLTKSVAGGSGTAAPGAVITYRLTASNTGNIPVTNVIVTDLVPANTSYVAGSTTVSGASVTDLAGGISPLLAGLNIGTIAPASAPVVTFQVRVSLCVTAGTTLTNSATIRADQVATSGSNTVTISVTAGPAPTITCPANITVSNDPGQCSAVVNYPAPTVTSSCSGVTVTCNPPSGFHFPKGTNTVTCTATNASGNTVTCTFTIKVNDTEPPTITCPPSVILPQDSGMRGATFVPTPAVAQDNCPGVVVTGSRSDGIPLTDTTYPVGATCITWTATDTSGNQASCKQIVNVHDSQIVGVVGQDSNGNHLPDPPQEPRLKGVTIQLRDPALDEFWAANPATKKPEPLAETQTNEVGNFSFPVAPPGVYDVVVRLLPGQTISALFPGPSNQAKIVEVNGEPRLRVTMQAGDTVAGLGILLQ